MSRYTADQFPSRWKVTKARRVATCVLAVWRCGVDVGDFAGGTSGLLLWNKLGSTTEVLNSAYGPDLGFYNTPGGFDIVGNAAFVPGVFGNGVSIGPGNYSSELREHTVVWSAVDQYLNPDRGTISVWYEQNSDPVGFDHGVYRIFDGSYGLGTGSAWSRKPLFLRQARHALLRNGFRRDVFGSVVQYLAVQWDVGTSGGRVGSRWYRQQCG